MTPEYNDRDLSWLSFNERVLQEAGRDPVPLLERINFLSIYSSNLDEFYRVRIPALLALQKIKKREVAITMVLNAATQAVNTQLEQYGEILRSQILPELIAHNIELIYRKPLPEELLPRLSDYFYSQVLAFLQVRELDRTETDFFPDNNRLYFAAVTLSAGKERLYIVNIPSGNLPRFFTTHVAEKQFVVFIDDIIRHFIGGLFPGQEIMGCYSFKITRDAELDLADEYSGDLAEKIEKQISKRDLGFATRLLHDPALPSATLSALQKSFKLDRATIISGGTYHNLKDFSGFPVKNSRLSYPPRTARTYPIEGNSLLEAIAIRDKMIHTPYDDYGLVLRFFNEAATHPDVEEIFVTMYRIASDSRIGQALITASQNGKQVTVFVELKARFDEENNLRWAKKMKAMGITIIYSIPGLKVHAKVALVKKRAAGRVHYYGLLATGNFNESTARFYTDHILFTANKAILRELELLFIFLARRKSPEKKDALVFNRLLVAQFNLKERFTALINREMAHVASGKPGHIIIKLNNLEETSLIDKLYEASAAGVKIDLIIRSICRLVPGVTGLSENITVKRIVDRYLEHGRIFWFNNDGQDELYAGSADWMNRNIYNRIEVCFPILDDSIKSRMKTLLELQLADSLQVHSQENIGDLIYTHA